MSNLTARQPHRAPHHVIQVTMSEELAQGPYVAARGWVEPANFLTEHHHTPIYISHLKYIIFQMYHHWNQ